MIVEEVSFTFVDEIVEVVTEAVIPYTLEINGVVYSLHCIGVGVVDHFDELLCELLLYLVGVIHYGIEAVLELFLVGDADVIKLTDEVVHLVICPLLSVGHVRFNSIDKVGVDVVERVWHSGGGGGCGHEMLLVIVNEIKNHTSLCDKN